MKLREAVGGWRGWCVAPRYEAAVLATGAVWKKTAQAESRSGSSGTPVRLWEGGAASLAFGFTPSFETLKCCAVCKIHQLLLLLLPGKSGSCSSRASRRWMSQIWGI